MLFAELRSKYQASLAPKERKLLRGFSSPVVTIRLTLTPRNQPYSGLCKTLPPPTPKATFESPTRSEVTHRTQICQSERTQYPRQGLFYMPFENKVPRCFIACT